MDRIVKAGGYDEKNLNQARLATPQASKKVNVYGLSVDVFLLRGNQ